MPNDITPTVAAIGQMHFEGNIIPHTWYRAIAFPNGKADVNAILILAEIVYWYRPTVERDEATGEVVSIRKKFKEDMLQRHYQSFADQFGLTKRQCQDAIARLVDKGIVRRELRTVNTAQGTLGNVPYFEPVVEAIQRISYHAITGEGSRPNVRGLASHGETYTKTKQYKNTPKKEVRPPRAQPQKKTYLPPPDVDPLTRR